MNNVNKYAFFVEGLTEVLFIEYFLKSVLPDQKYAIKTQLMKGKLTRAITVTTFRNDNVTVETEKYFLIVNCNGENNIRSYIDSERSSLIKAGYELIVGITDLYPLSRAEYHSKWYGHHFKLPQKDIRTKIIVTVMETEAWFLADFSHFQKIDATLTPQFIFAQTGLDLETIDVENVINHPADQLNIIYKICGANYYKKITSLTRTVQALNFEYIFLEMPARVPRLAELVQIFNDFIIPN